MHSIDNITLLSTQIVSITYSDITYNLVQPNYPKYNNGMIERL